MARRNRSNENDTTSTDSTTPEVATEAVPTDTEENSVTTTTEAPVEAVEATDTDAPVEASTEAAPATEAPKAEVEIDLTDFEAAVAAAVAERDESTGEIAEAAKAPVAAAYRALEGAKAKNAAKKFLNDAMREAMNSMDIQLARSYMVLSDGLAAAAASTPRAERTPADPTQALVERLGGLYLATELAVTNAPEGLDYAEKLETLLEESRDSATAYLAWTQREAVAEGEEDAPEPEVSNVVKAAVKLALGKSAKVGGTSRAASTSTAAGDGVRRDIGKHIAEVFENVESGTFLTVSEIRKVSTGEYSDTPPSAGAISSRLFPTSGECSIEGIVPGTNDKGNRGASKA